MYVNELYESVFYVIKKHLYIVNILSLNEPKSQEELASSLTYVQSKTKMLCLQTITVFEKKVQIIIFNMKYDKYEK